MSPLFSIVVPIYNIEEYIDQCILSIMDQKFTNFEVILVDDGSSDGCPQICDEYAMRDSRIKVIHKKNGGLVSARQAGVAIATGEYIACVDGDDWISSEYFLKFDEVINQYIPDIACCGAIWANRHKDLRRPLRINLGYYDRKRIENEIFPILIERSNGDYFTPSLWAKVFRREIYQQQQQLVDTFVNIGEDSACVKPCVYHSQSMYVMDDCLYYYRQNPASMTKKKKAFDWNGPKIIGQHFEKQIDMNKFDFQEQVYRNVTHNLFNVVVSQFNRNDPFRTIANDIKNNVSEPYYWNAVIRARFLPFTKGSFAKIILKYNLYQLIKLYNNVK